MLGHLRPWGLLGHVSISAPNRSKLNSQTVECLFIRYPEYSKGNVMTNEGYVGAMEVESRDVTFIEDNFPIRKGLECMWICMNCQMSHRAMGVK